MTLPLKYPLANTTAQWWEDDFDRATMSIEKLVLHSTETTSWPGYGTPPGSKAPTLTYNPWRIGLASDRWRQHNYLNTSARALQDPTSTPVRENRDGVVQIEIIGYCNKAEYEVHGHGMPNLPDWAYEDLGAFVAFMHVHYSLPLIRVPVWVTACTAVPSSIRLSSAGFDAFKGLLGHQHVSGNDHGDPGLSNAQVDRILTVARRILTPDAPTPDPLPPEDDMAGMSLAEFEIYLNRFYSPGGTGGVHHAQDVAWKAAMLGEAQAQTSIMSAQTDALLKIADALNNPPVPPV